MKLPGLATDSEPQWWAQHFGLEPRAPKYVSSGSCDEAPTQAIHTEDPRTLRWMLLMVVHHRLFQRPELDIVCICLHDNIYIYVYIYSTTNYIYVYYKVKYLLWKHIVKQHKASFSSNPEGHGALCSCSICIGGAAANFLVPRCIGGCSIMADFYLFDWSLE